MFVVKPYARHPFESDPNDRAYPPAGAARQSSNFGDERR